MLLKPGSHKAHSKFALSCHRKKRRHADSSVLSIEGIVDAVPRIHCSSLSPEDFSRSYEVPKRPAVITGLSNNWKARDRWTEEEMLKAYSEHRFKAQSTFSFSSLSRSYVIWKI